MNILVLSVMALCLLGVYCNRYNRTFWGFTFDYVCILIECFCFYIIAIE